MYKKTEIYNLDIPSDDRDCWERYPKHRWVYDLSRILDAQNIKWTPFEYPGTERELNINLQIKEPVIRQPGYIYIKKSQEDHVHTEVYIVKGEIKLMRHIDLASQQELPGLIGEIELRINAFVTLHFQKYTGVVSIETRGHNIYRVQLRPYVNLFQETNQEVIKIAKKIYKKSELDIGLTDRVRQEILAS